MHNSLSWLMLRTPQRRTKERVWNLAFEYRTAMIGRDGCSLFETVVAKLFLTFKRPPSVRRTFRRRLLKQRFCWV